MGAGGKLSINPRDSFHLVGRFYQVLVLVLQSIRNEF